MNVIHHVPWTDRLGNRHVSWIEARDMPGDSEVVDEVLDGNGYFVQYDDANISGGVVVDIGAHIGCVAVQALALNPKQLIVVEPNTDNYELLVRNLDRARGSTDTRAFAAAVGNPARDKLAATEGDSSRTITHYTDGEGGTGFVPVFGWDDILQWVDGPNIDFLKIDCEGGEYDLFETMHSLDRIGRIHMEWHTHGIGARADIGNIVTKLLYTHTVEVFGRPDQGGMLAARRNG